MKVFNSHASALDSLLSREVGQSDANLRELGRALYSPFRAHVAKYAHWESALLASEARSRLAPPVSKDLIDELRNVSQLVSRMATVFSEASKRCCDVTEGESDTEREDKRLA